MFSPVYLVISILEKVLKDFNSERGKDFGDCSQLGTKKTKSFILAQNKENRLLRKFFKRKVVLTRNLGELNQLLSSCLGNQTEGQVLHKNCLRKLLLPH